MKRSNLGLFGYTDFNLRFVLGKLSGTDIIIKYWRLNPKQIMLEADFGNEAPINERQLTLKYECTLDY